MLNQRKMITMSPVERRALPKGSAWMVPVPAASVAVPLPTASTAVFDGAFISNNGPPAPFEVASPTVPGHPRSPSGDTCTFQAKFQDVGATPVKVGSTCCMIVLISRRGSPGPTCLVWIAPVLTSISAPSTTSIENSGNSALCFTAIQALQAGGTSRRFGRCAGVYASRPIGLQASQLKEVRGVP